MMTHELVPTTTCREVLLWRESEETVGQHYAICQAG